MLDTRHMHERVRIRDIDDFHGVEVLWRYVWMISYIEHYGVELRITIHVKHAVGPRPEQTLEAFVAVSGCSFLNN